MSKFDSKKGLSPVRLCYDLMEACKLFRDAATEAGSPSVLCLDLNDAVVALEDAYRFLKMQYSVHGVCNENGDSIRDFYHEN